MYVTDQTFLEAPDDANCIFTTNQAFQPDTIVVTQGGVVVTNYRTIETTGVLFDTAPLTENGDLLWSGEQAVTDGGTLAENGFWSVADFRATFGVSSGTDAAVAFMLAKADARLKQYLVADVYADAQLDTPEDTARALLIQSVAGELARLYLQSAAIITGTVTSKSESYRGVKTYSEHFAVGDDATLTVAEREGLLIATLAAWQKTSEAPGALAQWWGTGRVRY